jgi:arabinofuranosyltransferase
MEAAAAAAAQTEPTRGAKGRAVLRVVIAALALVGLYAGWRAFLFLTDDAFIAFRYVSNSVAGHGLVWNPPPFAPVEGYTSFLWVALLQVLWDATGLAPPQVANHLALAFGCLTLLFAARFALRMALPAHLARHREWLLAAVLLGTLTNRTFLAWLSSGLETSLFNCCFLWWIFLATTPAARQDSAWALRLAAAATFCALSRPDGLLTVLATVLIGARDLRWTIRARAVAGRMRGGAVIRRVAVYAPLLVVLAHLTWRRWYYGDWLPNTFYAKVVEAWPESGLRYAACFALEYGVWVWALLVVGWLARRARGLWGARRALCADHYTALVALAVVALHFGYYTLLVGGDHFEYRVYSHLVPLLFVSGVWLAARVARCARGTYLAIAAMLVASWLIPWIHWLETRELRTRRVTFQMVRPIAARFPWPLRPAVAQWDRWQAWLIRRQVATRHQEHKVFAEFMQRGCPSRAEGARIRWEPGHPVGVVASVGVVGWALPEVAIIDFHGLNDRVIARSPQKAPAGALRQMAHDRRPPPGYVDCFRPNIEAQIGKAWVVHRRKRPFTAAAIRACEQRRWY